MTAEPEYISVNRRAYNRLAAEYRNRAAADRQKDVAVISPFVDYLNAHFGLGAKILDIGPGNGVNLAMFHDLGFRVAGIDISRKMLAVANELCPAADLRLGDFLRTTYSPSSFEGIFSKASIHLFPKKDSVRVIQKVADLLVDGGIFYVTTTAASRPAEGYSEKADYPYGVVRYRKLWTPDELIKAVCDAGLSVYSKGYNDEQDRSKRWFNLWAVKTREPLTRLPTLDEL